MSLAEADELAAVLDRVQTWPRELRITLAHRILEMVVREQPRPVPRGRPAEELIGLGAGSGPPPDDEQVKRWIDEYRMQKYGR